MIHSIENKFLIYLTNNMKNITFLILIILSVSCGQKTNKQSSKITDSVGKEEKTNIKNITESAINKNKYIGIYEYVYPDNTADLIENHYIVLSKSDSVYSGLYYGTTDEFENAREEHLPGFFVAKMNKLSIIGDTIKFTLNVNNNDFFTKAIDLKITSSEEARKNRYKPWGNYLTIKPKTYIGLIKNSDNFFFKGEQDYLDKKFIRIK